jgi:NAD(P)-dependent dehydrogenase (short-subunit alcohol dehydrogenase family)
MNPFRLDGKHIVISGASSGIGQQCAISCSAMGAKVSILGRNEERLKQTLSKMDDSGHKAYVIDLTQEDDVKELVNKIVSDNGRIDGLLNVAGISTTLLMKSVTGKQLQEFFKNNVYSAFMLTREVCKMGHFSKEGGSVVFFSSVMGSYGEKGKSLYAMTKGALQSGAKSLACELATKKIRVNTVSPGVIVTPINENLPHITDKAKREAIENMHLLGLGETEDVANACIYLLSDASKWVTGINLFIDGGYTAK